MVGMAGSCMGFPDEVNVKCEKGWSQGLFLFKTAYVTLCTMDP